jgi:hypothetical protein
LAEQVFDEHAMKGCTLSPDAEEERDVGCNV